ncbi:hypothetical protein TSOC_001650 [Tetrabaena socialis]|uniref:Sulfotransferase domain-containing protein n=1 Tax=Tetrabaena socialis TaxID=47790 RepID=A0A2J8AGC5_9CHLO|nr:hypothetical protein TSOC_001650 [Tetrabaena socialis]|eukprot:PNH11571.1 hypothetical protein TSOC_001650 [Tetrabaena socialis]
MPRAPAPAPATSLGDVLAGSALATGISAGSAAELLLRRLLADVIRTPALTKLRQVPEAQLGGSGAFLRDLLDTYPSLNDQNIAAWASNASTFLASYATATWRLNGTGLGPWGPSAGAGNGTGPGAAGAGAGGQLNISLTALSGLPMLRRVLLAQLATAWVTVLGRRLPEGLEPQLALLAKQVGAPDATCMCHVERPCITSAGRRQRVTAPRRPSWRLELAGSFLSSRLLCSDCLISFAPPQTPAHCCQRRRPWGNAGPPGTPPHALPPAPHLLSAHVRQLYDIHSQSVEQRGAMEYFHISKSGGTSWNTAARENGCVYPEELAGAHVEGFGDTVRWINQSVHRQVVGENILYGRWGKVARESIYTSCWRRYARAVSDGLSFLSNEYTLQNGGEDMHDTHLCPQMVNVVTLRDPIRRMASNVKFIMLNAKKKRHRMHGKEEGAALFAAAFCNSSRSFWEALAPPITDNYVVRSFLGEAGFHSPLGSIGPEAVGVGRGLLLQFDMVLDLDAGAAATDRAMYQGMRWPATLAQVRDPLLRMDSAVRYIMLKIRPKFLRRQGQEAGAAAFAAAFCNSSRSFWEALAPPVTDNYVVRSFLGEAGFHSPLGSIGPEAVGVGRGLLLQFDMVLDLDAGAAATDRAMYQGMRWPATLAQAHDLDSQKLSVRQGIDFSSCHLSPGDWEQLLQRQGPDIELYSFGRVLTQLDALWLDLAGVPDQPARRRQLQEAAPEDVRCGLLWRRSDRSVLARAFGLAAAQGGRKGARAGRAGRGGHVRGDKEAAAAEEEEEEDDWERRRKGEEEGEEEF